MPHNRPLTQTAYTFAISATVAVLISVSAAHADTTISTMLTNQSENWTTGNFTVTASGGLTNTTTTPVTISGSSLGTFTNAGTISLAGSLGTNTAINQTSGTLTLLTNSGNISTTSAGTSYAIYAAGVIDNITNTGTITAYSSNFIIPNAIYLANGLTGVLSNSGTINGLIDTNGHDLTITGGTSTNYGNLRGITASNLTFDNAAYQNISNLISLGPTGILTNNGHLRITASSGAATPLIGNYTQSSSGALTFMVNNTHDYGILYVMGTATISGTITLTGNLAAGQYEVITADAVNATNLTAYASGYTTSISSTASALTVTLTGGSSYASVLNDFASTNTVPGGAHNLGTMAGVLDRISAGGGTNFSSIFTALSSVASSQSTQAEVRAFSQLLPTQVGAQLAANNLGAIAAGQMVSQHQTIALAQADNGMVGIASGSDYQQGAFWAQLSGGIAHQDGSTENGGFDQNYYGMTLGADVYVEKDVVAGGAVSWVRNKAYGTDVTDGSNTKADSVQVSAYGSKRFGPAFVNGLLGIGYNSYDQSRSITFLSQTATASYHGWQYMAKVDGGWDFDVDSVVLTPTTGFQAIHTANNSYTESGAGATNLSVDSLSVNSFSSTVGGKAATNLQTKWGTLTPEVKLGWVHDWSHGPIVTSASMNGVGFTTETARTSRDGAQVGFASTLKLDDDYSVNAAYDGDLRDGYNSHAGTVKLKISF